ncbi:hypothetical protein QIS74_04196 [Colletotrichum tabaci]|uniref:Peptidase S8/S53 domain-containing protein n=1 Tax=Colletotrichum tabaci TaxID=1209068 RepID=A0AAV9TJ19_9PEZI
MLSGVTFMLDDSPFSPDWKPNEIYLQLLHHSRASSSSLEGASSDDRHYAFIQESHFSVLISDKPPYSAGTESRVKDHVVTISRKTIVNHPGTSFIVTTKDVDCFEDGSPQARTSCTSVIFRFRERRAATEFVNYLDRMKKLLQEIELQGPVNGENILYQREHESPPPQAFRQAKSCVTIAYLKSESREDSQVRTILTRAGHRGSVSLTAPASFLQTIERGPPYNLSDQMFWSLQGDTSKPAGWFRELEDVEYVLRTPRETRISENYRPVRVAVIDTAVDPSRKVVAAYDFINKCVVGSDKDAGKQNVQHGTQSVDLILKVYDEAVIFVAKIFDGEHVDEKQGPLLMAEAITWAVSQSVDIISISAGFASCPEELRAAVHQAHAAGILIFAAASNWGNTNEVAFPARIQDQVFCIFATTAALKDVPEINPEPRKNADNFALLGHDIDLPGHAGL